MEKKEPHVVE